MTCRVESRWRVFRKSSLSFIVEKRDAEVCLHRWKFIEKTGESSRQRKLVEDNEEEIVKSSRFCSLKLVQFRFGRLYIHGDCIMMTMWKNANFQQKVSLGSVTEGKSFSFVVFRISWGFLVKLFPLTFWSSRLRKVLNNSSIAITLKWVQKRAKVQLWCTCLRVRQLDYRHRQRLLGNF